MPTIPPRESLRAKTEKPVSRRFVVISALLIAVGVAVYGVILAVVMERTVQEAFVESRTGFAAEIIRVEAAMHLTPEALAAPTAPDSVASFRALSTTLASLPEVVEVNVYGPGGVSVWSNVLQGAEPGKRSGDAIEVMGTGATAVGPADSGDKKKIGLPHLLEIYQPVYLAGAAEPAGVVEIYFDAASVIRKARTAQIIVMLAALSSAAALISLLFFALGKLQRKYVADLEAKVRERTRELDTALKDAERLNEGLSRANTKLGIAIESLEHGVIVFDLEKSVTMINGRARSLFDGSSPALPTFSRIAERLRPFFDFEDAMEKCFSSAPVELGEVRLGDGHFDARCLPLMSGGASFGTLLFLMDVTAQNELERVRTEFTAMLVHELRTPLTNMRWTLEAVLESLAASSEEAEQLTVLLRSAASMRALVDDILDLSKIEAGKFEISPKENDLGEVIAAKVKEFRSQAEAKGLALSVSGTGPLPRMTFDETRIGQALANLLSNALKFTEKGSVTVAAAFDAESGRVRVSVSDTGPGILADGRVKLFQKYVQLGGSKDKNMGTGLGLAIVKGIVEAHGGAVGVGSEEGKGSAFWFELPAANGVRS